MNRRILIIASCALVLSICASYLVYRVVSARGTTGPAVRAMQLVVASRDLVVGTLVHDSDLKMALWSGPIPKGAMLKRDAFLNRGVVSPIYEGEPVIENRLFPKGSGGGLAATIPIGMRACAVRVNEVVGVAGFVIPGMRVDVLITGPIPGSNGTDGPGVTTLLQNIQVLSAGTNFQKDREGKPEQVQVVNLLVTPSQAEILSLASNETRIQLVLRNPMDTAVAKTTGSRVSNLFGGAHATEPVSSGKPGNALPYRPPPSPPVTVAPAGPGLYVIDIANGAVHTQAKFSKPEGTQ